MPVLRVLNGALEGQDLEFEGEVMLGKEKGCDLQISDPGVSRRHAKIVAQGGSFTIEDTGSANGTFVNFARKRAGDPAPISDGDVLFIGRTVAKFYAGQPPASSADGAVGAGGADAGALDAAREEAEQLRTALDRAQDEITALRSQPAAPASAGTNGDGGGGIADEEALRTLLRGTIPIHGLTCPKCAADLEEPFRAVVREREQLEVVRRLKLHQLDPRELEALINKAKG